MSWIEFIAEGAICKEAIEKALPEMREEYGDIDRREITETIGERLFERQRELRDGRPLGLDYNSDSDLINRLASEVPDMYRGSIK